MDRLQVVSCLVAGHDAEVLGVISGISEFKQATWVLCEVPGDAEPTFNKVNGGSLLPQPRTPCDPRADPRYQVLLTRSDTTARSHFQYIESFQHTGHKFWRVVDHKRELKWGRFKSSIAAARAADFMLARDKQPPENFSGTEWVQVQLVFGINELSVFADSLPGDVLAAAVATGLLPSMLLQSSSPSTLVTSVRDLNRNTATGLEHHDLHCSLAQPQSAALLQQTGESCRQQHSVQPLPQGTSWITAASHPLNTNHGGAAAPGPPQVQPAAPPCAARGSPLPPYPRQYTFGIVPDCLFKLKCSCPVSNIKLTKLWLRVVLKLGSGTNGVVFQAAVERHEEYAFNVSELAAVAPAELAAEAAAELAAQRAALLVDLPIGKVVALKIPNLDHRGPVDALIQSMHTQEYQHISEALCKEHLVMLQVSDSHVIKSYAAGMGRTIAPIECALECAATVQEFADCGDVETWACRHGEVCIGPYPVRQPMEPGEAYAIMKDVALGLRACHDVGVGVRDLKPANVMLSTPPAGSTSSQLIAKLVDFGSATDRLLTGSARLTIQNGTPLYTAPERALPGHPHDGRADVYSLGIMLLALRLGRANPFAVWGLSTFGHNPTWADVRETATKRLYVVLAKHSKQLTLNEVDCVTACLTVSPAGRPSVKQLLQQPYLRDGP